MTSVDTAMEAASRRRREDWSVIDAMAILESVTERAEATPTKYASCLAVVNSARNMATVAVNAICESQSEHPTHAPPSGPEYPASHTQSVNSSLPAAELECKGHRLQLSDPAVALNVPAVHSLHATPFESAVYPGRHAQSVSSLLPAAELV